MIRTIFGWGIILNYLEFCGEEGYRVKLTENSACPNKIIEFYLKKKVLEYE